jgi:hypothetical protein
LQCEELKLINNQNQHANTVVGKTSPDMCALFGCYNERDLFLASSFCLSVFNAKMFCTNMETFALNDDEGENLENKKSIHSHGPKLLLFIHYFLL